MAYPYPERTRVKGRETLTFVFEGSTAAGTEDHALNLPPGAWMLGVIGEVVGSTADTEVTLQPYVDREQTAVGTPYDFIAIAGTVAAGSFTLTSGNDTYAGQVAPILNKTGTTGPVIEVFGSRLRVAPGASAAGTYKIKITASEI